MPCARVRDVIVNGNRVKKKPFRNENHRKSPVRSSSGIPVRVVRRPGHVSRGSLIIHGRSIPVALGRSGIRADKREGDGATPLGIWHPREVRYRADHGSRPLTRLPVRRTQPGDGWCDDPVDGRYNQPVRLPFAPSHERMWRDDALYDLVVVLDHNSRPRQARRGSAVFLHLARDGFLPTEGCIAFRRADLRRLLTLMDRTTRIRVV